MQDKRNNNQSTQMLNSKQQQELVSKSDQLLTNFQKLDSEIKFSSRDFQNQFDSINAAVKKWSEGLTGFNLLLDEKLTVLAKETTILTALPDRVESRLSQIIPLVATEIQKQTYQNFDASIKNASDAIDRLNEKIQTTSRSMLEISHRAFKKKLLTFAIVCSVTILGSTLLTYSIMQLFPKTVIIDTKGDIRIDGGNVSVWGTGKNKLKTISN